MIDNHTINNEHTNDNTTTTTTTNNSSSSSSSNNHNDNTPLLHKRPAGGGLRLGHGRVAPQDALLRHGAGACPNLLGEGADPVSRKGTNAVRQIVPPKFLVFL